jgi:hypothetical protein
MMQKKSKKFKILLQKSGGAKIEMPEKNLNDYLLLLKNISSRDKW